MGSNNPFVKSLTSFKTARGRELALRTDVQLVWLMWLHVPAVAVTLWANDHEHWIGPMIGAVLIALLPNAVYLMARGSLASRSAMGVAGMLFSALLIHASGGMIELHFHVFVMLAVLCGYRDYRVLLLAAGVIAVHHIAMNFLAPYSLFRTGPNFPVVLLHALFVVLETVYLVYDIFMKSDEYDFVISTQGVAADISDASMRVTQTSTEFSGSASQQAAALQQISATMTEIEGQTRQSAGNVTHTSGQMAHLRGEVNESSTQMQQLVASMGALGEDSKKMSGIIKVIDNIAFQTNLLALNAAVEAARAGDSGRGFAVVTEEVRNLAGNSAQAAKNIAALIESAMGKVAQSTSMAGRAAEILEKVLSGIGAAEKALKEIAQASQEQVKGSTQVSQGLQEIDKITQQNSANAEAGALAATALSHQVLELQAMLYPFSIENGHALQTGALSLASDTRHLMTR
jgi:methyl-accepting chemotaxis protein